MCADLPDFRTRRKRRTWQLVYRLLPRRTGGNNCALLADSGAAAADGGRVSAAALRMTMAPGGRAIFVWLSAALSRLQPHLPLSPGAAGPFRPCCAIPGAGRHGASAVLILSNDVTHGRSLALWGLGMFRLAAGWAAAAKLRHCVHYGRGGLVRRGSSARALRDDLQSVRVRVRRYGGRHRRCLPMRCWLAPNP